MKDTISVHLSIKFIFLSKCLPIFCLNNQYTNMTFEARFPEIFYVRLEAQGWEPDNVNTNDMFRYETAEGCAWEVMAGEPGTIELELNTYDTSGHFFLEIHYHQPDPVLDMLTGLQEVDGTDKDSLQDFFINLIEIPDIQAFFIKQTGNWHKKEEIVTHQIPVSRASVERILNPRFKEVPGIDFYLAGVLESRIVIRKENFDAVLQKLKLYYEGSSVDLSQVESLPALIEKELHRTPRLDEQGNIVDVLQGGDSWMFEALETVTEYIENGSFTLLQDDGWELHRIDYHDGTVTYHSEDLSGLEAITNQSSD